MANTDKAKPTPNSAKLAYISDMLKAILDFCGVEVYEFDYQGMTSAFSRDHYIILEDKNILLYPTPIYGVSEGRTDLLGDSLKDQKLHDSFQIKQLNTEFEAGNYYIYQGKVFYGYYLRHEVVNQARYKLINTTDALSKFYGKDNVILLDLSESLKQELLQQRETASKSYRPDMAMDAHFAKYPILDAFTNTYFHLDTYICFLPDNKVLVLNTDMISESAKEKLNEIFGRENIINLNYAEYLSNPVMMNIQPIQSPGGQIVLVSNQLPKDVSRQIRNHGYTLIQRDYFKPTSGNYKHKLDNHVRDFLRNRGWNISTEDNLFSKIPSKTQNSEAIDNNAESITSSSEQKIDLSVLLGGPHCLMNEYPIRTQPDLMFRKVLPENPSERMALEELENDFESLSLAHR